MWSQILKSKEVQKRSGIEEPRHLCRKKVQEGVENKMLGLESVCGAARPFDPLLRNSTQPCHFHYTPLLPSLKVWSSLKDFYFSKSTSRPSNIILCPLILWDPGHLHIPPSSRHHQWNLFWCPFAIPLHSFSSSKLPSNDWVKYQKEHGFEVRQTRVFYLGGETLDNLFPVFPQGENKNSLDGCEQ